MKHSLWDRTTDTIKKVGVGVKGTSSVTMKVNLISEGWGAVSIPRVR